ncbi:MAG: UDP-N-acetylglucosamine 2-epimerase (non-hydrolyzing) [Proteobacteria bacterium]|nr:UDP-N-acetylglucosamine 2-epimerase (non-hydrolyzing) [Pseudomonadota bacterium]
MTPAIAPEPGRPSEPALRAADAPIKILCVAGARPNFVKIAPLMRALAQRPAFAARLVHTGQHYDAALSSVFFDELRIPRPDLELEVGSGTHAQQTAEIMRRFEPVVQAEQPQAVLVVGDVNSTIACALVTAKTVLDRPFACALGTRRRPVMIHVEAGLRSGDDDMPEEINRKLTDAISDLLFVSEPAGLENLRREGVSEDRLCFAGNVMIDTLLAAKAQAQRSDVLTRLGLRAGGYGLLTLHRPSNVDDPSALAALLRTLDQIAEELPLVFPVHPRTRSKLAAARVSLGAPRWHLCEPLGYLDFLRLTSGARVVLTDSGGVQEETTVLGVRCLTLRDNTERPVTVSEGTNTLAGTRPETILAAWAAAREAKEGPARVPALWDGQAADRIVAELEGRLTPPAG